MTAPRRIYDLLPELYRRLDAQHHHALRELTEVLEVGRGRVKRDVDALYRDWFVETAGPAALGRIAVLVGAADRPAETADHRAFIADAVAYHRREGTRAAAETRLRDVSGWPVAVGVSDDKGSVAIQVWPNRACRSALHAPSPYDHGRNGSRSFWLHPLGIDVPLHQVPAHGPGMGRIFSVEHDAPLPLGFDASPDAIARAVDLQVADASGAWHPIAPERIVLTALDGWATSNRHHASAAVAIDPRTARLVILDPALVGARLLASFGWVPPGKIGGGSYDRAVPLCSASWVADVDRFAAPTDIKDRPPVFSSLSDALAAFRAVRGCGLIRILDSTTHEIGDATIHDHADICLLDPDAPRRLTIEAGAGESPTIRGELALCGEGPGLDVTLDGLWIDGTIAVDGKVTLQLTHCTLHACSTRRHADRIVPAISVGETARGQHVTIAHSLVGPLDLAPHVHLDLAACVVDGYDRHPAIAGRPVLAVRRSTVIGDADVAHLMADDTLFAGALTIEHRDRGHIASSVVIDGPDVRWRSAVLGQPGYARRARQTVAGDRDAVGAFGGDFDDRRAAVLENVIADVLPAGQRYTLVWR